MLTPSLEDYLEELYRLSSPSGESERLVRPKELSDRLNVSMPSVTKALQRLSDEGHVVYRAYGNVDITEKGRLLGAYLVRRNSILMAFVSTLRVDCDAAECVEAMEHYIAPEVVVGLERLLGFMDQTAIERELDDYLNALPQETGSQAPRSLLLEGLDDELDEIRQLRRFGGKVRPSAR